MSPENFQKRMNQLIAVFGESEFPTMRMRQIFEAVADLPDKSFSDLCFHFEISKPVKYPPLPKDFIEQAHAQRKVIAQKQLATVLPFSRNLIARHESEEALNSVLKNMGAKDLHEAVRMSKGRSL